jgi:hypothetical protein
MIKKWIEFIKESKELKKKWKLDEEEIKDLLVEITDLRYKLYFNFGMVDDDGKFSKNLKTGEINPAYLIYITDDGVKSGDVTLSLLTMCDYLETKGYEVVTSDSDGILDRESLIIDGGIFYKDDSETLEDRYSISGDLEIFIKQLDNQITMFKGTAKLDTCKITEKDLAEYYSWTGYELIGNNIYLDITLNDLASYILSSHGYDKITNGIDEQDYYNYSEKPDIESLFNYYLDKENQNNLLKIIIDEVGLEEVIEINDKLEGMNEDEIIQFILSERYYYTLKELCRYNDNDILDEVKLLYSDMEVSSHIAKNTEELYYCFDKTIGNYFKYTKLNKDYVTYYKIDFDEKWIEDRDYEFLEKLSLNEIFQEYCSEEGFGDDLNPNFSDYGSVDLNDFNKEVKSILK